MISKLINRYIKRIFGNNLYPGSRDYWEARYNSGDNSGNGSYGELAIFKAKIINEFVSMNKINSIIEFGCGDGNQLAMLNVSNYIGLDVSEKAIKICHELFNGDSTKEFHLYKTSDFKKNALPYRAELGLSLDVIYHLIEDSVFEAHINDLLNASNKYAIIYASNKTSQQHYHVKHREFVAWIKNNRPDWKMIKKIPNKYPKLSFADFYIFEKSVS